MTGPGNRRTYRHTAIQSYAKLAGGLESDKSRERAAEHLAGLLDDWYVKTRATVIGALQTLGEPGSADALRQVASSDPVESIRSRASRAATAIEAKRVEVADKEELQIKIQTLSEQIDELRKDLRALQARVPQNNDGSGRLTRKEDETP